MEFEILTRCGLLLRKEKIHGVTVELTYEHHTRLDGVECTREVQEQQSYILFRLPQVSVHMTKQCQYGILGASVCGVCELHWVLLEAGSCVKST